MNHDAARQLHIEGPQLQGALGGHAHQPKRLGQQRIERFAAASPATQL